MERLCGYLILGGLLFCGIGAYRWFFEIEDAGIAAGIGVILLVVGVWLSGRTGEAAEEIAEEAPAAAPPSRQAPEPKGEAIFSVIESGDDVWIDLIERVLSKHPEIASIVGESGRYYSNPDRDDLPEWHALRVYCPAKRVDAVMAEADGMIRKELGAEAANAVRIQRYS